MKISYSKLQLEAAVNFLAINNLHFKDDPNYIRAAIIDFMNKVALDRTFPITGTMGFILWSELEEDDDGNQMISFEILVDPAVGLDYDDLEFTQEVVSPLN